MSEEVKRDEGAGPPLAAKRAFAAQASEAGSASGRSLVRAAGMVSGLTLVSRVLGLAREQAFAWLLGAGMHADSYQMAFRIPNLLRDLFAEGALSAAFVPTYARVLAHEGRAAAERLASRLMTFVGCLLVALCLVAFFFSDAIVAALAPGYSEVPGKAELTVFLTRVMLPFLPLVSFAAIAMGMLNAEERYGVPALSPALFNVVAILVGLLLWALGLPPDQVVLGWSIGTLLGGAAQFFVQVPSLRSTGWRFRPQWAPRDPAMRSIGGLMIPATVGLAAVQINIFVNSNFASHEPGAVSWLQYAFRLLYLPIGLFGVAVGTIATTGLAKRASAGDFEGMRQTLQQSLRMLAFLNIPATIGLTVLAEPIVRLLYERGAFQPSDTEATATALLFYSLGLVAYTGVKVLAPAFYALGTPRVPLAATALAVATNLAVILALHEPLGYRAVALGTSLGSLANALLLGAAFERRLGGLLGRGLFPAIGLMIVAAGVMAPITWLAATALEARFGIAGLPAQLVTGLVPVMVGAAAYMAAAWLLRIPEASSLLAAVRRRRT